METALRPLEEESGEALNPAVPPVLMDFGDYELLEQIGRGGQGVVFRARQKSLNRIVALKVIALGHWATEAHIKRFRLEAEAAASLDHPRIVPIYEIGERDGSCYFSMKYVDGGQLDEVVRQEPLPLRRAVELIVKLARTVQYAHERGILHRDIKPGNVLLDGNSEPNLTDFGLARLVETESNITNTMEVFGTPSYIAPEQARGEVRQLTAATDVYGLGAVFYQLLTGHPPFAGGTTFETIRLVLETEPRKPRLWNPKVDRDLETICLKCLEKDPQRRYTTALSLAEDLERWSRHEPIRARPSGLITRSRKWVLRNPVLAAVTPLVIALIATLGVMFWRSAYERPPAYGIAVLPFDNLGDDKENAFLADGIQDDILTKLAKVAELKVISRTSVMQYRGERNVRKIGDALRVSHVLEGSVRKTNGRVHLNAQLIDARRDIHVWAEEYDGETSQIFAIQTAVAQDVVRHLRTKVSGAEKSAIEKRPTEDLEAYDLYLRAKTLSGVLTPDDPATFERMTRAVDLLEKAVARDPSFALGYCLLTEVNLSLYWTSGRSDSTCRSRAEAALQIAERLAPDTGETHLARALFYHYGNRDLDHALAELDVAARSLPNNADVFRVTAHVERRLGRWSEAVRHFSKACELDPRNASPLTQIVITHMFLRRYVAAEQTADRGIGGFPEGTDPFWNLKGEIALEQADVGRARFAVEKISATTGFPTLRFKILFYERNYAEAERFSLAQWQGKDAGFVRFFAFRSALVARAEGDTEKMRSFLLAAYDAYVPLLPDEDPGVLSEVGLIEAALGRKEDALRDCRKAVELRPISRDALEGPEYATNLAAAYVLIGDHDHAIEQLSSVMKVPHGPNFGELKLDPIWDDLRDDPRFAQILADAAAPISIP